MTQTRLTDPSALTIAAAQAAMAAGRLTARGLLEACLERVAQVEPVVRALTAFDAGAARAAADAADRAGRPGLFGGIPFGAKDVLDSADLVSGYGSPIWAGHRPRGDAAAIAMTRAAGGILLGKTVTTEFATRRPGPTANPWHRGHTPGGSSSGSAAGVAAGFFPAAFGTQTAGSILRPAAFNGVAGYKPSYGTIHRGGMKVMSESLDTIGALGRTLADCAMLVAAAAGLPAPPAARASAPRILFCPGPAEALLTDATRALLAATASRLSAAGARVADATLPPAVMAAVTAHPAVMNGESAQALAWERATSRAQISDGLLAVLDQGAALAPGALDAARVVFADARATYLDWLGDADLVLTASAPGEAPEGLGWTGDPACNLLWTALHGPCASLPAGVGPAGLPLGVQLVGRFGADDAFVAAAGWVEAALG
ncbi:amidase family protein [Humitalea sp. 24SJ18S-53]|uniref:amidase family protein n=1 Tax=Humitalea sp. 24SJ18S-53 TaxID=3422307 RepID=UPI003D677B24